MALRKIFCPQCGNETQIDDEKPFVFCINCGGKIELAPKAVQNASETVEEQNTTQPDKSDELEKKLEEVNFYYQLSRDKNEDANYDEDPMYYLKAQDMLVDLSQEYPDDYRIWWELCKPIDFNNATSGTDINGQYRINEDAFGKALDRAELSQKRKLIEEHDRYIAEKKSVAEAARQKRIEEENRRQQEELKRQEEERKLQEEEFIRQEKIRNKQLDEEQKQQKIQQEKQQEEINNVMALNAPLWNALLNMKYQAIDNSYFVMPGENSQSVMGVFKVSLNVVYLMEYHIETNRRGDVHFCQSIPIKFDGGGRGYKMNNSPIRIKGLAQDKDILYISNNGMGFLNVNGFGLQHDENYINSLGKYTKKSLLDFTKYFN